MRVRGLSASWCGKCDQAKMKLVGYNIEWLDVDKDSDAKRLVELFKVEHLPFFIIGNENDLTFSTANSALQVKRMLE